MRIGIDIKAFKNGTTGIARYLRSIMDWLQKFDHSNDYFLFECTPSAYQTTNSRWKKVLIPWSLPGILWQQFILPRHCIKHAIDVLWSPEQICPIGCPRSIRLVTTIHDLASQHFPEASRWSVKIIHTSLTKAVLRRSDRIIAISDFTRRDILHFYPDCPIDEKITVIPMGHPGWALPDAYSPSNREEYFFFAGNNEPRKNLIALLKAMDLLDRSGFPVSLKIAGPAGWKNREVHDFIASSPVKGRVTFLGYIDEDELRHHYLTCKALVYPSLYEGFGLPVLEALSQDCLVLTSRGTVMEEIARESALYFDPYQPESIANTIKKVIDPLFDRKKYVGNKEAILADYSWKKNAQCHLSVLTTLA